MYLHNILLGLDEGVTEQDVKNAFYSYGEIRSLHHVPKQVCTFITTFVNN